MITMNFSVMNRDQQLYIFSGYTTPYGRPVRFESGVLVEDIVKHYGGLDAFIKSTKASIIDDVDSESEGSYTGGFETKFKYFKAEGFDVSDERILDEDSFKVVCFADLTK